MAERIDETEALFSKDFIEAEANKKFFASLIKHYWDRMSEVYDTASYIIYLENLLKANEIEFDHRKFKVVEDIREWRPSVERRL